MPLFGNATHRREETTRGRVNSCMAAVTFPLTLSEQLDAMLAGWLDRHDPENARATATLIARAVITVAGDAVPEVEAFCAQRGLRILRTMPAGLQSSVLVVEGDPLTVQGFAEITSLYRH
jgi:hypothetical protein